MITKKAPKIQLNIHNILFILHQLKLLHMLSMFHLNLVKEDHYYHNLKLNNIFLIYYIYKQINIKKS